MTVTAAPPLPQPPRDSAPLRGLSLREDADRPAHAHCSTCHLRELCLPCGLADRDIVCMDKLIHARKRIKRGQILYRDGDPFHSLYAVRSGSFKSSLRLEDGREQVSGFHMMDELMGMDGIGSERHTSSAIALEDSEVGEMSYAHIVASSRSMRSLLPRFHKMMSREIVRENGMMLVLGSMRAEQRLAVFLMTLSQRYTAHGYSPSEFNLRMSRQEICSYLGMNVETVSRMFLKLQCDGLINVQHRQIRILDAAGLKSVAAQGLQ